MFPEEIRDRQEKLSGHIYTLSEKVLSQEEALGIIQILQMIYEDNFKHSYSDFFPVISHIFDEGNSYNDEYLMTNLEAIREILEVDYSNGTHKFKNVYAQLIKLCDHLNLQISEMKYFTKTESKINDISARMQVATDSLEKARESLENAHGEVKLSQQSMETAKVKIEEANARAGSLQTELIAVLSIFAAIVITFSGGFTFFGSVMTSISGVNYYEVVVLAAIICGMFMFNTIFLMMYLVAKITDRNIYARCLTPDCSCENGGKCKGIKRIRKRLPYVFYFNILGLLGITIDCIVWFIDLKGVLF